MFIKKPILEAYKKAFGFKELDKEAMIQADPLSFKAILAVFRSFEEFVLELRESREAPKKAPAKVTK